MHGVRILWQRVSPRPCILHWSREDRSDWDASACLGRQAPSAGLERMRLRVGCWHCVTTSSAGFDRVLVSLDRCLVLHLHWRTSAARYGMLALSILRAVCVP